MTSTTRTSGLLALTAGVAAILVTGCATTPPRDTSGPSDAGPSAEQLLRAVGTCKPISGAYKTDDEPSAPANVSICGLSGAVFWQADMDIDCDGKTTDLCNLQRDPWYQAETSATDSKGQFLDASTLPYVVIPLPSSRFDYAAAGLGLGSIVAVIYDGKVAYGPLGDVGPANIIGEASYAMATQLGIDPSPKTGGTDGPVTYIAFLGANGLVKPIEDHAAAERLGQRLAGELLSH